MDVNERIQSLLDAHALVVFMKGTPQYPMCGYSSRVVQVLREVGIAFHAVNVQEDAELRAALPRFSNWPTFPQVFLHGELLGGSDIVLELKAAGDLQRLAADIGPHEAAA